MTGVEVTARDRLLWFLDQREPVPVGLLAEYIAGVVEVVDRVISEHEDGRRGA